MESSVCIYEYTFLAFPHQFQVYDGQSNFIDNMLSNSTSTKFGMPVDNLNTDTSIALSSWYLYNVYILLADDVLGWNLFAAAMTPNQSLRSQLISKVHNRASFNTSAGAFPVEYNSADGSSVQGVAR